MACLHAAIGLALVCLVASARADATGDSDALVFEQDFLMQKIGQSMLALPTSVKGALNGTLKKQPATAPKRVRGCQPD